MMGVWRQADMDMDPSFGALLSFCEACLTLLILVFSSRNRENNYHDSLFITTVKASGSPKSLYCDAVITRSFHNLD